MKKTGDGRRIQRVEREVQGIVSQFLMGTFTADLPGLVTVTQVRMPADLRSARVYVSILNGEMKDHEEAAELLQRRAPEIQRFLADKLPLRYTPRLHFEVDRTLDKVMAVDRILHELSTSPKSGSGDRTDAEEGED